jgi:ribosome assembly protein RRB1
LLASGDDKGQFAIWDLRIVAQSPSKGGINREAESITRIRWHKDQITSIQFEPREDSVVAVVSADDKLTIWDFSVEVDESETANEEDMEIPPQLMF